MKHGNVRISDLIHPVRNWNPSTSVAADFVYVDISSVDAKQKMISEPKNIPCSSAPSRARQLLESTDVLVSTVRPNLNCVAYVSGELEGAIASTGFCVLRPNKQALDSRYLFHWVQSKAFIGEMVSKSTGASYPAVSDSIIHASEMPLPPLEEQRRIAAILDKASALKKLAFRQLLASEEAETYLFHNCLGSPFPKLTKWPVVRLSELGLLERGVSKHRPRNDPTLINGPYPFIQTGDVAGCHRVIEISKSSYSEKGFAQSRLWPKGTLCITIAANIAKTGILGFEACFPDSVVGFQSDSPAVTTYVQCWMGFLQKHIEKMAPESAQKNINLEILRELEIPLPDKEALRKFHDQVLSLRGHWIKQRSRHERLGELNCSLSSQLLSIHNT